MRLNIAGRTKRLHEAMSVNSLDGLVYGTGANFQYLTGLPAKWTRENEPSEPDSLLVICKDREPRVVTSQDEFAALLGQWVNGKRIGVSRTAAGYLIEMIRAALPTAECVDAEELGEQLRLVKDAEEIAALRKVAALTDQVMAKVVEQIRPGITQPQLQAKLAEAALALGAQDVSFLPAALYVKSGSEPTENPFVYPKEKGLVQGTSIAFDFGFVLNGYCSDFGRSFYCGPAPGHISGAYRALQQAQCHLIAQMRPGMCIGEMSGVLLAKLDALGYGDRFRARVPDGTLGHQIGIGLHENPWIRPGCNVVLEPGMVMAVEPKLWLPGDYYLRVEDMVLITDDGAESLTSFDRELFELPV